MIERAKRGVVTAYAWKGGDDDKWIEFNKSKQEWLDYVSHKRNL